MKRKMIGIFVCMLLIATVLPVSGTIIMEKTSIPTLKEGNTLYVGGNGTGNYSKIQDAIDDASNGDTVFVYDDSSPYYENLVVNKSIILKGEDKDTTVIDGSGGESVVDVSADGVTVSGFTLQNYKIHNGTHSSIIIIQSDYNFIYDNLITGNTSSGIYISYCVYNNISNNIIYSDFINDGVFIESCNHTAIENNWISVSQGHGLVLIYSDNNDVLGNTLTGCAVGIHLSITIDTYIYGNIITNSYYTGIILDGFTSNSVITRNNISYSGWVGLFIIGNSRNDEIIQNNFIGNKEKNAYFIHPLSWIITFVIFDGIKPFFPKIHWNENYWDETRLQSYIIPGFVCLTQFIIHVLDISSRLPINWVNLDRNPAQEPYDIGV